MFQEFLDASLAQLAEHVLRKRMVVGSIPTGGSKWVGRGLGLCHAHSWGSTWHSRVAFMGHRKRLRNGSLPLPLAAAVAKPCWAMRHAHQLPAQSLGVRA